MKAMMTGAALAALLAASPALAASQLQVAQAEPQAQQTQEEVQNTPSCPEGQTANASGECEADAAAAAPAAPAEGTPETEAAETVPAPADDSQAATTEEQPVDENAAATTEQPVDETEAAQGETLPADDAAAGEESTEMAATDGEKFIGEQADDAFLASELIGQTVYNSADEALGDVNDVVWSEEGGIDAIVVGVGGFLGIGEKSVAVSYDMVNITTDENGNKKLILEATEEELSGAPEFLTTADKLAELQSQQTMPADGGGMAPAPAPVAPAQ
jgi:hypothetical protein